MSRLTSDFMKMNLATKATLHCLVGCNIGEVLGAGLGFYLGFGVTQSLIMGIAFAFIVGYAFTMIPLLRHGIGIKQAGKITLGGDTASISAMEIAENGVMFLIPGFLTSSILEPIFLIGIGIVLAAGFVAAYPVNHYMIKRGTGHQHAHMHH
jgi:hypothetical protein